GLIRSGGRLDVCKALPGCVAGYREAVLGTGGLVGYWRLGESSGSVARDELGAHAGTYVNPVTLGQAGAISGDSNTSVLLGSGGYVSMGKVLDFTGTAPFSLEAWIKWDGTSSGTRFVMGKLGSDGGVNQGYGITIP